MACGIKIFTFNKKANQNTSYLKSEVDSLLMQKANTPVSYDDGGTIYSVFDPVYGSPMYKELGYWQLLTLNSWTGYNIIFAYVSSFYRLDHYTTALLNVRIEKLNISTNMAATILPIYIHEEGERLYYYVDHTNNRCYLYMQNLSGNSTGKQELRLLCSSNGNGLLISFVTTNQKVDALPEGAVHIVMPS